MAVMARLVLAILLAAGLGVPAGAQTRIPEQLNDDLNGLFFERRGGIRLASWTSSSTAQGSIQPATPDPLGDCASRTLAAEAIVAACTALHDRWLRHELNTGQQASAVDLARMHLARSDAHRRAGNSSGAIEDADRAVALLPRAWQAYAIRALARRAGGDESRALEDWDAALRIEPGQQSLHQGRANTLVALGREPEAMSSIDRAVGLDPNNAASRNLACWYRGALHGRELDVARRHCDAAIRLAPENGDYLDSRGMVGLKEEKWQQAWTDYDRAVRLNPDRAHPLFGRGIAALRLGRTVAGEADLAAARRIDPSIDQTYARYAVTP